MTAIDKQMPIYLGLGWNSWKFHHCLHIIGDLWIFEPRIFELSTLNPDIWTLGEKGIFEPQTFELCIFEPVSFEPCIFEPLVEDEFLNPAFLNP